MKIILDGIEIKVMAQLYLNALTTAPMRQCADYVELDSQEDEVIIHTIADED